MDPVEQLGYVLPTLSSVVERIQVMQMNESTPLTTRTVHDVIDDVVVLAGSAARRFRGELEAEILPPAVYGWVPREEFRASMDDLLAAVKEPGAMTRPVATPLGEMLGATYARLVAFRCVLHGCDLAGATGVKFALPPAVFASLDHLVVGCRAGHPGPVGVG